MKIDCQKCGHHMYIQNHVETHGLFTAVCPECNHSYTVHSILKHHLNQRIENSIDYGEIEYLSNQSPQLYTPNTLTFIGASMGIGKTYTVFQHSQETQTTTIILVPRVSLAMSLYKEYKDTHSVSCWCSASQREDRHPGRIIHIATPPILPTLISKLHEAPHIAIDEIDFFDNLLRADILSQTSRNLKEILKAHIDTGIVALGQTAFTTEIELFTDEIGAELQGIYATKKTTKKHKCQIIEVIGEHGKGTVIQKTIDTAIHILNKQKRVYIFADGRKTTHIIKQRLNDITKKTPLVFDRYTRGSPENQAIIQNQGLTPEQHIFISSNAVDVGISFTDPHAEVIVCTTENLAHISSARSLMQRALRNRTPCPIHIITFTHKTMPVLPKVYRTLEWNQNRFHATEAIAQRDQPLIKRHAIVKSLNELAAVQIYDFIEHHAPIAGIDIQKYHKIKGEPTPPYIFQLGQAYQDECKDGALQAATDALDTETLWSETRISKEGALGRLNPQPTQQLGYEMLNTLARTNGWNGRGCESLETNTATAGIFSPLHATADEQLPRDFFPLLRDIIERYQDEINTLPAPKTLTQQVNGFTRLHTQHSIIQGKLIPNTPTDHYTYEPDPNIESIHTTDDRLQTEILFQLVTAIRDEEDNEGLIKADAVRNAIQKALTTPYAPYTLQEHLQRGHLGTHLHQIASIFHNHPEAYIPFAIQYLHTHYPTTLTQYKEHYKLTRSTYWQLIKQIAKMRFQTEGATFRFLHEDWFDFDESTAKQVIESKITQHLNTLISTGMSVTQAAKQLGISRKKAYALRKPVNTTHQITTLRAKGYTQKTIATQLGISERTVKRHWT